MNALLQIERKDAPLIFVDVETTGPRFGYHEIIDVAAVRTVPDASRIVRTFQRRLRPMYPERCTSVARRLNGFSEEEWSSAEVPSNELWEELNRILAGAVPVCHNPTFDRAFIELAASQHGLEELSCDYHWIGTESMAWPMYVLGHLRGISLDDILCVGGYGAEERPHSAYGGAIGCLRAYRILMERRVG